MTKTYLKCDFCGWIDDDTKEWHKLDDGYICRSCYGTAKLGVEVNFVEREKRVRAHNRAVRLKRSEGL